MKDLVENFEAKKIEYARLIISAGINVQKGQKVFIESVVENADMAYKCMDAAYAAGASDVVIFWRSEYMNHERMKFASEEVIENLPSCDYAMKNEYIKLGYSFLQLRSLDPNLTNDIDTNRANSFSKSDFTSIQEFLTIRRKGVVPWSLTSIPKLNWAKCVFPDKSDDEALASLWNSVFKALEITGDGKSLDRWNEHKANLEKYTKILNDYHFKTLHYENSLGTDLYIDLLPEHNWVSSCQNNTVHGQSFTANIPTEEVFTAPLKTGVNGVVYSARPLILAGQVVEGIRFEFKDGKMISIHADSGEEVLVSEIDSNKNARYLGEVALVPYDSPISKQKQIFYDGLYDENASCHLAFGFAIVSSVKNWQKRTNEDFEKMGFNLSPTHVDFMVGTKDLNIEGITDDGKKIPVFKNGNFAF